MGNFVKDEELFTDPFERFHPYAGHAERGPLLLEHEHEMDDRTYWRAVAEAWQDSDRQPLDKADWRRLFNAEHSAREHLMVTSEQHQLAALPERVTVYRGVNAYSEPSGISWTLDRNRAEWFARRFPERPDYPGLVFSHVITGRVLRKRIIAIFNARQENEVLVFPHHVYQRRTDRAR